MVSFDLAYFKINKIYFQFLCRLAQLFLNTSHFTEKDRNRFKNFFPALNCNLVDFLKNQEIDGQIQAFTDETETSYIAAFLNGTNCRLVDYKYCYTLQT